MVQVNDISYCVKFALPRLKVAAEWCAPVHRNAAEFAWLKVAADVVPESAVRLFGQSETMHGFAMEYVAGDKVYLWKTAMLQGKRPCGEAQVVGDMIGRIHAASAKSGFDRSAFRNRDDFHALRIEPYLSFTAGFHPRIASQLETLGEMLYEGEAVLVHGDVSPKNILMRDGGPVILDAECATMGDASFDPAFCLNHLVLKAVHVPSIRTDLLSSIEQFWSAYASRISWEEPAGLESRVSQLLPALMLARIDGKSPVEYLDAGGKDRVRAIALSLMTDPVSSVADFTAALRAHLKEQDE